MVQVLLDKLQMLGPEYLHVCLVGLLRLEALAGHPVLS
jgi:hypothetical protein